MVGCPPAWRRTPTTSSWTLSAPDHLSNRLGFFLFFLSFQIGRFFNLSPIHKTLPRSSALENLISARYYETDCRWSSTNNNKKINISAIYESIILFFYSESSYGIYLQVLLKRTSRTPSKGMKYEHKISRRQNDRKGRYTSKVYAKIK